MPELPEVEILRRSLDTHAVGRRVERATLRRADICRHHPGETVRDVPERLLEGAVIARTLRHGKQLAVVADSGRVLSVHLGMTGHFAFRPIDGDTGARPPSHTHATWELSDPARPRSPWVLLSFSDPRRFGGLWTFPDEPTLRRIRWSSLGPDGLTVTPDELKSALAASRRAIKAALLDQSCVAGVGNIYADEALFLARIDPRAVSSRLTPVQVQRLAESVREVLTGAIEAGGSTIRDFKDSNGQPGRYQDRHLVYGRSGLPCPNCRRPLTRTTLAQRTTVFCSRCQVRRAAKAR